jgi:CBS domain-containing protein
MSPRAACRLEALGFTRLHDYTAGIADWKAAGLPVEGEAPEVQRVADATRPDIPTSSREETIGDVRRRTFEAGWDEAVVLGCDGMVVGRLRNTAWEADDRAPVEEIMEPGPTTVRPNGLLQPLVERMEKRGTNLVVVTTPQGELIGAMVRDEAKRLLTGEPPERIWKDCDGCPGRWEP